MVPVARSAPANIAEGGSRRQASRENPVLPGSVCRAFADVRKGVDLWGLKKIPSALSWLAYKSGFLSIFA